MSLLTTTLMTASALVIFALGTAHLIFTFRGNKLHPRDSELEARLREVSPVLTRQTTMWKAWIGFNASHSYGAMFYGLVYGYLALAHGELLFSSPYLLTVGFVLLVAFVVLAWRFWFSVPFRGIVLATGLYLAAIVANWSLLLG